MGTCIICGTDVDGHVCASHEEDAYFEFTGTRPDQLERNRFYEGTVDGYAEFGVFVDIGERVTGLLHRSELPRRLESLDWEPGDTVYVQVTNVRDNGNVDLSWSIRQAPEEFRGHLVHTPEGDELPDDASREGAGEPSAPEVAEEGNEDRAGGAARVEETRAAGPDSAPDAAEDRSAAADAAESEPAGGAVMEAQISRSEVAGLADEIGSPVRLEGEVLDVRQTGGPTIFEVRDETGTVDCAAFEAAGVRAYPEVGPGDVVRVDGLVEDHRGEVQVESESIVALEGEERTAVVDRLAAAIDARAAPEAVEPLVDHPAVGAVEDELLAAATAIRRAVFEGRPVVLRHRNSADGYVAAAAIEHAVLPLVREEHDAGDAEYHYVDRRPLDGRVYGLADAMRDVTKLLDARERHGERTPLFVLVGAGSTAESVDGLDLLGVYGADRAVVDAGHPDDAAAGAADPFVNPHLAGADAAEEVSTTALAAAVAATVNPDVRDDLRHLPAVSYWRDPPSAYVDLAVEAGVEAAETRRLREAVALEAYYQVFEDKRELVADLLFGEARLAEAASEQFRSRLESAVRTAEPHLERWPVDGGTLGVLDTDAYTHRYDFPPADVLLAALADAGGDLDAVLGVGTDELVVWSRGPLDRRAVAEAVAAEAPEAGVEVKGGRDGSLIFLAGEREAVLEAAIEAVAAEL